MPVTSPYPDDLTRIQDTGVIIEQWIQNNWTCSIPSTSIAFGVPANLLLQSGKGISLRCYTFFSGRKPITVGGGRWRFEDHINIDVYVMDNNSDMKNRNSNAIIIQKYLEAQILQNQGNSFKGIYMMDLRGSHITQDLTVSNVTKIVVWVAITYIADVT